MTGRGRLMFGLTQIPSGNEFLETISFVWVSHLMEPSDIGMRELGIALYTLVANLPFVTLRGLKVESLFAIEQWILAMSEYKQNWLVMRQFVNDTLKRKESRCLVDISNVVL